MCIRDRSERAPFEVAAVLKTKQDHLPGSTSSTTAGTPGAPGAAHFVRPAPERPGAPGGARSSEDGGTLANSSRLGQPGAQ
eukprot:3184169-Heterocapsa_arctica.AAC.1